MVGPNQPLAAEVGSDPADARVFCAIMARYSSASCRSSMSPPAIPTAMAIMPIPTRTKNIVNTCEPVVVGRRSPERREERNIEEENKKKRAGVSDQPKA